jgi:hypothetical protein
MAPRVHLVLSFIFYCYASKLREAIVTTMFETHFVFQFFSNINKNMNVLSQRPPVMVSICMAEHVASLVMCTSMHII